MESHSASYSLKPIGYMQTCFPRKNGTPRQSNICSSSRGVLKISKDLFSNPDHSLCGIESFSHVWVLFIFHLNQNKGCKAKVKPPRLDGAKVGVFASRTPHRPNQIGLTLAKLEHVSNGELYLSGIDIVDGTPVVDIKPYIPMYDVARTISDTSVVDKQCTEANATCDVDEDNKLTLKCENLSLTCANVESGVKAPLTSSSDNNESSNNAFPIVSNASVDLPEWLEKKSSCLLEIMFTRRALTNIDEICCSNKQRNEDRSENDDESLIKTYCENTMCSSPSSLKKAITEILQEDPRSTYRKVKCADKLYFFLVGPVHVTVWFDKVNNDPNFAIAEVLKVERV